MDAILKEIYEMDDSRMKECAENVMLGGKGIKGTDTFSAVSMNTMLNYSTSLLTGFTEYARLSRSFFTSERLGETSDRGNPAFQNIDSC